MKHHLALCLPGALALAALALPAAAQTSFQGLGTAIPNLNVTDMSPDGSAIVGCSGSGTYLWTTSNPVFTLIDPTALWDADVSDGGAYVSATLPDPSNSNFDTPARWDASTGQWTFLGGLGGTSGNSVASSYDISADGQVVVGLGWVSASRAKAFRWSAATGMVDLGTLQGFPSSSRAEAVSADGNTIVGWDSDLISGAWRAARWSWSAGGITETLLGCLDPADPINGWSHAYAVSRDGTYVAGESSTGIYTPSYWGEMHAFRWDAVNGQLDFGTGPVDPFGWGTHNTVPTGISDDGVTVVGWYGAGFFGAKAFISRQGVPASDFAAYLTSLGVPEGATWGFADVIGISGDGRILCGNGYNAGGAAEVYRVTLPPVAETYCTAKTNSQGCTPAIAASGMASLTSSLPFTVSATNVINQQNGLLYYGHMPQSAPFQGGTKCVLNPSVRTPLQNAGGSPTGTDCTGSYAFDFNAWTQSGIDPALVMGSAVYAQYWSRDPISPSTTGLTNAVHFTLFP